VGSGPGWAPAGGRPGAEGLRVYGVLRETVARPLDPPRATRLPARAELGRGCGHAAL